MRLNNFDYFCKIFNFRKFTLIEFYFEMVIRIVIAGEIDCEIFAQACLIADYLSKNLPSFRFERIRKSTLEWKPWLHKINQNNGWYHSSSPVIWKEILLKGSKPYYIGGVSEFLEYCYSYYQFEAFLSQEKFCGLVANVQQFDKKLKAEKDNLTVQEHIFQSKERDKSEFIVCISGSSNPLTMVLISQLLEMSNGNKSISKIYLYDNECSLETIEKECSYVLTQHPGKVVKYIEKIGIALIHSDLLIVLDHIPFKEDYSIGEWLNENEKLMNDLALMINASALPDIRVLLPNLGPACFNATILRNILNNVKKYNIVVATSDLGLEISSTLADIAGVPMRNLFCPPVWGFVGINHIVDTKTTIHKYNSFEPYNRYAKVNSSSLTIGVLTPTFRTMEYLMYFDDNLWTKITESNNYNKRIPINKVIALVNVVDVWLIENKAENIINLGIQCDGTFGLTFNGVFSQPARFLDGRWKPAKDFLMPRDHFVKLPYLVQMAEKVMKLEKHELPKLIPYYPCTCKQTKKTKK